MSTVTEIKEAIANLSPQEYCELIGDLQLFADDEWDTQMKADASSGKLDFVDWSVKQTKVDGAQVPLDHILWSVFPSPFPSQPFRTNSQASKSVPVRSLKMCW